MKYPNLLAARAFLYIGLGYLWCSKEVVGLPDTTIGSSRIATTSPGITWALMDPCCTCKLHVACWRRVLQTFRAKQSRLLNPQTFIIFQQNLVASIWVQWLLWWRTSFVFFIKQAHSPRPPQAPNPRIRLRIQADGESRCWWWNLLIHEQSTTTHCAKILFASILRNKFAFPHAKLEIKTDTKQKKKKKTPL